MRLLDKVLIRDPRTDRMVHAVLVERKKKVERERIGNDLVEHTTIISAFTPWSGRITIMRFDRTSRYAPACVLCSTEETDDPMDEDRLWNFSVAEADRKISPAHNTLLDAIGGPGWGKICTDCIASLEEACLASGLRKPGFWLAPRTR